MKRRRFLKSAGIGAGVSGLAIYSYQRGIRFPLLSLEPAASATEFSVHSHRISTVDLIKCTSLTASTKFRAYAPEPEIIIQAGKADVLNLSINNIAHDAELQVLSPASDLVKESKDGITRLLEVTLKNQQEIHLKWRWPNLDEYTFAAIGDTGAGMELDWCLQRAEQLNARFLLHLGDFNYQPGDYSRAVHLFHNAPLPVYVSIGNHDFHDNGLIYDQFLSEIGPFNNAFSIGNTRFVNIDTAASMLPYSAGHRGQLMQRLVVDEQQYSATIGFTHRPLYDPLPDSSHDIGSENEMNWLINALKKAKVQTLLSGHIHIYDEADINGINNIIAGQGLGHQDLITATDYSKLAIGHVNKKGEVSFDTAKLSMPMEMHCHPRVDPVKDQLRAQSDRSELIQRIDRACNELTE